MINFVDLPTQQQGARARDNTSQHCSCKCKCTHSEARYVCSEFVTSDAMTEHHVIKCKRSEFLTTYMSPDALAIYPELSRNSIVVQVLEFVQALIPSSAGAACSFGMTLALIFLAYLKDTSCYCCRTVRKYSPWMSTTHLGKRLHMLSVQHDLLRCVTAACVREPTFFPLFGLCTS